MPASLLILVPTYNEADNLRSLVARLFEVVPWATVLVIDDESPDGTGQLAEAIHRQDARVQVLHRTGPRGLGRAYVDGFCWGLERGYDYLFEMDADLSHDPAHLPAMLAELERGASVVVGSRNIPGGRVEGWDLGRHLLSRGGSLYSRGILGLAIRDLTTGYKGYTRQALETLEVHSLRSNGYSFQIETTYRALKRGLRVEEVPIVFVDRRVGRSKMNWRIFLEAVWIVWKLRTERRLFVVCERQLVRCKERVDPLEVGIVALFRRRRRFRLNLPRLGNRLQRLWRNRLGCDGSQRV